LGAKLHNPENADLARELYEISNRIASIRLPNAQTLQVTVRSNRTGMVLTQGSLAQEAILTVLASRCEWYTLLQELAQDLVETGEELHSFALFGLGDCLPLMPFHQRQLKIRKIDVMGLSLMSSETSASTLYRDLHRFSDDAIAIVGAACRLPGATTIHDLWGLMSSAMSTAEELPAERIDIKNSFRGSQDAKFISKRALYGNFLQNVDSFDSAFFQINPKEAMCMDPQQRIMLEVAFQAMDSSGYLRKHRREHGDPVGCFVGASFTEYLDNIYAHPPTAYTTTGNIRAFLCGRISYHFGWTGPSE
jgi:hypothetical protein